MKLHLCLFALLAPFVSLRAATWTVDNNTSHPADFRTIQDAVEAAAVGDTILVSGSNIDYPQFVMNKRLYIRGQAASTTNVGVTILGAVKLRDFGYTSDPDYRHAGGSVLEGLTFNTVTVSHMCAGVKMDRCLVKDSVSLDGCTGSLILNCRVESEIALTQAHAEVGSLIPGIYATDNTVVGTWAVGVLQSGSINTMIENCVLGYYFGSGSQTQGPVRISSNSPPFVFRNTILIGKQSVFYYSSGNSAAVFDHCLSISDSALPDENGNLSLAYSGFADVFQDATAYAIAAETFLLKAGSPAIGAGTGGVDMGMYGGIAPFVPGQIPALPRILYLAVPPLVPDSTGLTFEVRAEARD